MSCPRTHEIDWAAYAADPTSEEWAELRAHFPLCPDCSRERAHWTVMRLRLEAGESSAHPAEEELLAYDRSPAELTSARRDEIERHMAGCARCRNEIAVLAAMVPVRIAQPVQDVSDTRSRRSVIGRITDLFTLSPVPAWGGVAAAVLALVIVLLIQGTRRESAPEVRVAVEDPVAPRPRHDTTPDPDRPPPDARLAEQPPTDERPSTPSDPEEADPTGTETPESTQLAERPSTPPDSRPSLAEGGSRTGAFEREAAIEELETPPEIQLAALELPMSAPVYDPSALLSGAALDPTRIDVVIRSGSDAPAIRVLGPVHTAITFETSPRLYWHLTQESNAPVELIVVDRDTDAVAYERWLEPPVRGGLHLLDLAAHDVRLEPGRAYLFFASIVPDPDRRDLDRTSGLTLETRPDAAPSIDEPGERPQRLARAGSWLDAFATLQDWLEREPELERGSEHRAALLEQIDRDEVARALE